MDLMDLLKAKKSVLLDGAMGTEMLKRGIPIDGRVNLSNPGVILEIHKNYLNAGSEIILSNTFSLNRLYLETHNMDVDLTEANEKAVAIALDACDKGQYVLGDIGPTGQFLEPLGCYITKDFYSNFEEQASLLADCGVDGFLIETMGHLEEALCALHACRDISPLPVFVSITFSKTPRGFYTMMGDSLESCAVKLSAGGASVIGTNCGDLDPFEMAEVALELKSLVDLPLLVKPNAGKPRLVGRDTVYDMSPADFAEGIGACVKAGAGFVGGCCGTTPAHIQKVKQLLA